MFPQAVKYSFEASKERITHLFYLKHLGILIIMSDIHGKRTYKHHIVEEKYFEIRLFVTIQVIPLLDSLFLPKVAPLDRHR